MSTGSPTSRLIMKVARIVLGADGLELQAVDDLSPPRLGQSDAGDDLSERATIRADERDRSSTAAIPITSADALNQKKLTSSRARPTPNAAFAAMSILRQRSALTRRSSISASRSATNWC